MGIFGSLPFQLRVEKFSWCLITEITIIAMANYFEYSALINCNVGYYTDKELNTDEDHSDTPLFSELYLTKQD